MKSKSRTLLIACLMLLTSVGANLASPTIFLANQRSTENLEQFIPASFGDWIEDKHVAPLAIDPRVAAQLANVYSDTLSRTYVNSSGQRIMLSLAYGRDQRGEGRAHYPEICYPAQGFQMRDRMKDTASVGSTQIPAVRLVGVQGKRVEPITYWMLVGDEIVTSELEHKAAILRYSLKGQIPDGLLVRISTISADQKSSYALHDQFAATLISALPQQQRHRVVGKYSLN